MMRSSSRSPPARAPRAPQPSAGPRPSSRVFFTIINIIISTIFTTNTSITINTIISISITISMTSSTTITIIVITVVIIIIQIIILLLLTKRILIIIIIIRRRLIRVIIVIRTIVTSVILIVATTIIHIVGFRCRARSITELLAAGAPGGCSQRLPPEAQNSQRGFKVLGFEGFRGLGV